MYSTCIVIGIVEGIEIMFNGRVAAAGPPRVEVLGTSMDSACDVPFLTGLGYARGLIYHVLL